MIPRARKLTLGVLYVAVALLVAVPPVYILGLPVPCTTPPCTFSSSMLFKGDIILLWLLPFSIAAVLLALAFRLKTRR
ncbi:hypothetical protein [Sulfitobacter sp. CW3]|uniref:hypothetical protein n=1 Tax=Sulfitobacter sp. CW3 TaxID=2861965 RepID=UPI001C5D5D86|nr:hypothetical protein [Sulfitobacter sp. CW3]MBW4960765.1 hypothetical protein [Sulfitobacter sp. CW3]